MKTEPKQKQNVIQSEPENYGIGRRLLVLASRYGL